MEPLRIDAKIRRCNEQRGCDRSAPSSAESRRALSRNNREVKCINSRVRADLSDLQGDRVLPTLAPQAFWLGWPPWAQRATGAVFSARFCARLSVSCARSTRRSGSNWSQNRSMTSRLGMNLRPSAPSRRRDPSRRTHCLPSAAKWGWRSVHSRCASSFVGAFA